MVSHWIGYLLLGLIGGLSEILPVSASANDTMIRLAFGLPEDCGIFRFLIRIGGLAALLLQCGRRIAHMVRQMRMMRLPARRRKLTDTKAVRDARVILGTLIPMIAVSVVCKTYSGYFESLPAMTGMLVLTGILIYIPQHFPSGNRDSRGMARVDGFLLGIAGGVASLPGMSAMGTILCAGLLRGCDREYILELSLLIMIPVMVVLTVFDLLAMILAAFAGISVMVLLAAFLAGIMAFAGCYAAISVLRYLAVRVGFSGFAYYSWGLAMLTFILYLMT